MSVRVCVSVCKTFSLSLEGKVDEEIKMSDVKKIIHHTPERGKFSWGACCECH